MSVFGAGLASMPGRSSASSGAIFDSTPATDKWRGQMQAARDKLREKYGGPGPYTVATVVADLEHWWLIAKQFAEGAPELSTMTPSLLKQAKVNAQNLFDARAILKLRKPAEIVDSKEGAVYLAAMMAPIDWLIETGSPVLSKAEERSPWKTALYVGLGVAAIYGLSRLLSSGAELTREVRSFRPAPAGMVHNPPAWAADPELWETARLSVEQSGPYENADAVKVHVYKQLGGRVS